MSGKKNILLTFDYEPYLGARSGSAEKCLLQPTEYLCAILNKHTAKAVFFIDVLYLKNLKAQSDFSADFEKIIAQIKKLYQDGHFIFPHVHPHWKDAVYDKKQKGFSLFNLGNYSIASQKPAEIKQLFTEGMALLKGLGINYSDWGYRAGGWCIQPFSSFKEIFSEQKIKYEFSVLPGYKNENPEQTFDFSSILADKPYFFSEAIETPQSKGEFIEFPISTVQFTSHISFNDRLVRKYLWKTGDRGWGDGISAQTSQLKSSFSDREMISIELLNIAKLSTYMHWISHPKMFTKHGLKTFDSFLSFAASKYEVNFDFTKMIPH
jgi:hypothetical protein